MVPRFCLDLEIGKIRIDVVEQWCVWQVYDEYMRNNKITPLYIFRIINYEYSCELRALGFKWYIKLTMTRETTQSWWQKHWCLQEAMIYYKNHTSTKYHQSQSKYGVIGNTS